MPEILHRCVEHVMEQGHDESSAYAICRSSLGLAADGSEDGKPIDMPMPEMRRLVAATTKLQDFPMNGPVLRKQMVVCTPFGDYVNGDQEGEMTAERLQAIADNFKKYPRQVPIYAMGDHVDSLDERLPTGWVEGLAYKPSLPGYPHGALVADVKLQGDGARFVMEDLIRGASIGTVQGRNPDGSAQGEVLHHLLLTNNPFDKSLNIAAARKSGEPVACFFTALSPKEAAVADTKLDQELTKLKEENTALRDEVAAFKAKKPDDRVEALETLLRDKSREAEELRAANANLTAEVKNYQATIEKNPQLEQAMAQLKTQERQIKAAKIRRLVGKGVNACQFNIGHVGEPEKGWDNASDEVVLAWFKTSIFNDSIDRLEFALASFEKKPTGQKFRAGAPPQGGDGEVVLSKEDKEFIKQLGMDPEAVQATMTASDYSDFKAKQPKKGN